MWKTKRCWEKEIRKNINEITQLFNKHWFEIKIGVYRVQFHDEKGRVCLFLMTNEGNLKNLNKKNVIGTFNLPQKRLTFHKKVK